jgi:hypothetical protein
MSLLCVYWPHGRLPDGDEEALARLAGMMRKGYVDENWSRHGNSRPPKPQVTVENGAGGSIHGRQLPDLGLLDR